MILHEALIGGTVFLEFDKDEMAKPESERVAFDYRALTNKEKSILLHQAMSENSGLPPGISVCELAVTKVKNLKTAKGEDLDTIQKLIEYPDTDNTLAYMLEIVGMYIWRKQAGEEVGLKNSE